MIDGKGGTTRSEPSGGRGTDPAAGHGRSGIPRPKGGVH
jgi:hypothetical protein